VYSGTEQEIIDRLLWAVKAKIATKRILLKQPFQDFDRTRCSHITVDQFSRVLTQLGLLPKEEYLKLFVRKYIDNGNPKEVNYVKFCDDVDNV
jgi:Ca2+-binding EF-hand superfamily protein